jgi:hypothetical protein
MAMLALLATNEAKQAIRSHPKLVMARIDLLELI